MIPKRKVGELLICVFFLASAASAQSKVDRILVLKQQHELLLLSGQQVIKLYHVALGRGGLGPKERAGDRRTPEGVYTIDARNPMSRYHLALHISYPEQPDLLRAHEHGARPGGDIMIHGLGPRYAWVGSNHRMTDWTNGCIAVTDKEMDEIWSLVPDGTPIEIRP